MRDHTFDMLL